MEEVMEKGKLAEREQLIRGMHKNGMDIENISKFTNMDISEIRHIVRWAPLRMKRMRYLSFLFKHGHLCVYF